MRPWKGGIKKETSSVAGKRKARHLPGKGGQSGLTSQGPLPSRVLQVGGKKRPDVNSEGGKLAEKGWQVKGQSGSVI